MCVRPFILVRYEHAITINSLFLNRRWVLFTRELDDLTLSENEARHKRWERKARSVRIPHHFYCTSTIIIAYLSYNNSYQKWSIPFSVISLTSLLESVFVTSADTGLCEIASCLKMYYRVQNKRNSLVERAKDRKAVLWQW